MFCFFFILQNEKKYTLKDFNIYMNKTQWAIHEVNKINKSLINNNIKKKQKILIPISGGQDSICLFFIFIHLKKQWQWSVGIVYCNHLWQKNSFYSGSLIIKIAYLFSVPIYYAISSNKVFKEKNSRYWRYDCFYRLSFFYQYDGITLGHTLNDKIETSFFQKIRGSSLKSILCLNDIKYFYSKNKFTRNSLIKTTRNYNRFIETKINKKNTNVCKTRFLFSLVVKPFIIILNNNNLVFNQKFYISKKWHKNYLTIQNKYYPNFRQPLHKKKSLCKTYRKKNLSNFFSTQSLEMNKTPMSVFLKQKIFTKYRLKNRQFVLKFTKISKTNNSNQNSFLNNVVHFPLLYRPVLVLNRFDIKKIMLFLQLPLFPDLSNQKRIFYRNRIRKDLLPTLKYFFNPQIEKSFFQFEEILFYEQIQLILLFKRLLVNFYLYYKNFFQLNESFLVNIPVSIQRQLINHFLKNSKITQIKFINIQNTLNSLEKKSNFSHYKFWFNLSYNAYCTKIRLVYVLKSKTAKYTESFTSKQRNFQQSFESFQNPVGNFFFITSIQVQLWGKKKTQKTNLNKKVSIRLFKSSKLYKKNFQQSFENFPIKKQSFFTGWEKTKSFPQQSSPENFWFINQFKNYYVLNRTHKVKKNLYIKKKNFLSYSKKSLQLNKIKKCSQPTSFFFKKNFYQTQKNQKLIILVEMKKILCYLIFGFFHHDSSFIFNQIFTFALKNYQTSQSSPETSFQLIFLNKKKINKNITIAALKIMVEKKKLRKKNEHKKKANSQKFIVFFLLDQQRKDVKKNTKFYCQRLAQFSVKKILFFTIKKKCVKKKHSFFLQLLKKSFFNFASQNYIFSMGYCLKKNISFFFNATKLRCRLLQYRGNNNATLHVAIKLSIKMVLQQQIETKNVLNQKFIYKTVKFCVKIFKIKQNWNQIHKNNLIELCKLPFSKFFFITFNNFFLLKNTTNICNNHSKNSSKTVVFSSSSNQNQNYSKALKFYKTPLQNFVKKKKGKLQIITSNYFINRFYFKKY